MSDYHHFDVGQGRLENGVKARADGGGDGFAGAHRMLGRGYSMHDLDAMFGIHAFGRNTGDSLFVEYEPDSYKNRTKTVRGFAVVALFDRKSSVQSALCARNSLSTAFYLHICRALSAQQPKMPRFFYCCGPRCGPWMLVELDPATGDEIGERSKVDGDNIGKVWRAIGLQELRRELSAWVNGEAA